MTDYNRSEALDLSFYDLPALKPEIQEPERERPVQEKPQRVSKVRYESVASASRAIKIFVVSALLILLFGSVLFSKISLVMLERDAENWATKIKEAKSENTRLVMQLNSAVSLDKVDEYAVSVLGMHKLERYQIHYFGNTDGDEVVVAGGKAVEKDEARSAD